MKLKISTLFHWLYATLMFLPLLMFIPSCFYYGFNEHATNTETTTINYKYESNEVNSASDLIEDNIYLVHAENKTVVNIITNSGYIKFRLITPIYFDNSLYVEETQEYQLNFIAKDYIISFDNANYVSFYSNDSYSLLNYYMTCDSSYTQSTITSDFIIQLIYCENVNLDYFSYTDYNVIESVSVNTDDTISDKVNRAWSSVWDLPLFSWTHNSFVAAPFSYITGLFGLGSDNSINYVFTYFVSISICWLVFDLIMYVPNLAHRWLDRSAIE